VKQQVLHLAQKAANGNGDGWQHVLLVTIYVNLKRSGTNFEPFMPEFN